MTKKLTASRKPIIRQLARPRSKRNKYGVASPDRRTGPDGFVYDSMGEMDRFLFLDMMRKQGKISGDIERQIPYPIIVNGQKVCKYIADFVYTLNTGKKVIEDFKGKMTPISSLKKKLFEACYNEPISIVKSPMEWHD